MSQQPEDKCHAINRLAVGTKSINKINDSPFEHMYKHTLSIL